MDNIAEDMIRSIKKVGKQSVGRNDLIKHLEGEPIVSRKKAMTAKCYDCMGYCADGAKDCEIPGCPMYNFQPWKK